MNIPQLVPYGLAEPGFEAVYGRAKAPFGKSVLKDGRPATEWCVWQAEEGGKDQWKPERKYINGMQKQLGHVDEDARRIRAYIPSIEVCDSGFPLTIEEVLRGIGAGKLPEPSFRAGCRRDPWWNLEGTQPRQVECMGAVEASVRGILAGETEEHLVKQYPVAGGFVRRAYAWLGPCRELTELQRLLIERMLVGFGVWSHLSHTQGNAFTDEDLKLVDRTIVEMEQPDGRGAALDTEIDALLDRMDDITEEQKDSWRHIRKLIAAGLHGVCDCHHSSFRRIEAWVHAIGTGQQEIPNRKQGVERQRLARTSCAYMLALDKWLLGSSMQFLLLDIGHMDLPFDPRNEILRTYAYLGEDETDMKQWLAACLWMHLSDVAGWIAETAIPQLSNVSLRQWIDARLKNMTDNVAIAGE